MKFFRVSLAIIGGLSALIVAGAGVVIFGAGMFWLLVFGDDPWPTYAEPVLLVISAGVAVVAGVAAGIGVWILTGRLRFGRPVE